MNREKQIYFFITLVIIILIGIVILVNPNKKGTDIVSDIKTNELPTNVKIDDIKTNELPMNVKIDDIKTLYLCKTSYMYDDKEEYKKNDLYDKDAQDVLKNISNIVSNKECIKFNTEIEREGLAYKYLINGYNENDYIEFRIEIYVYNENLDKEKIIIYETFDDIQNPKTYKINNEKLINHIINYMDNMSVIDD